MRGGINNGWIAVLALAVACGNTSRDDTGLSGSASASASDSASGATSATSGATDSGLDSASSADNSDGDGGGTGSHFDVGSEPTSDTAVDSDGGDGCAKVDFLFVVDNSPSMFDEQQQLVASFPGFMSTIEDTLDAQDYQIMVVDTDSSLDNVFSNECFGNGCTCDPNPGCCYTVCYDPEYAPNPDRCNDAPCDIYTAPGCEQILGSGLLDDPASADCGVVGGNRYMVDGQPDLAGTFECLALVGEEGNNHERPMQSMMTAVGTLTEAGECNDGFIRDDAILVVTFITDEPDNNKSIGDPPDWRQALLDAKQGNADAIVVLGLFGDQDVGAPVCPPYDPVTGDGAEPAPRLRELVESMGDHGLTGSVCAGDFTPFFEDAVSIIDNACDEFRPEG